MENEKVIDLNEGNIKFKAKLFFEEPRLWGVFMKIKPNDLKLLVMMKRIAEKLKSEGEIIDSAIKDVQQSYFVDGKMPKMETPEFMALDKKLVELLDTDIELPYPKIKLSQIKGIESVGELNALEGIIEIDLDV